MTVELAWELMLVRMQEADALPAHVKSVKAAFCAGVYAASADVLLHQASATALSQAADRVEQ